MKKTSTKEGSHNEHNKTDGVAQEPDSASGGAEVQILKTLRSLMPAKPLTLGQLLAKAERQAKRFLSLSGVTSGPVPLDIVTKLHRVHCELFHDLPLSASVHWNGRHWVIKINGDEPETRQRFSLMHEFKHIIDHPVSHIIYERQQVEPPKTDIAERVANYFAACVLMPAKWVRSAHRAGMRSVNQLAEHFQVSPEAMIIRLHELGLPTGSSPCGRDWASSPSRAGCSYSAGRRTPRGRSSSPSRTSSPSSPSLATSTLAGATP